ESIIEIPGGEVFAIGWKQDTLNLNYESSIINSHPLWRTKSIHQNQKLKCIVSKNNSELFIGGFDYLNGGRSVIYKCDNKGENLELKYNSVGQIVNSMQFIAELNGIAVGDEGLLLKTQDGGNTWLQETVTTTEDLNFVKFSSQLGFIGGNNGLLLRTSDSGSNWTQISLGTNKDIMSILIHTQNNIWLVGKDGLIMKSEDAGLNWVTISASSDYDLNSIASKSNLHIGIYGGKKVDGTPFIMESHNSGNSWVFENTSSNLRSINFVYPSGNSAWAVGDYGTILNAAIWFTPVELTSFTATLNRTKVNINWQTATELNNQGFEIQRKIENYDWATIGFRTGKGTTTEHTSYFYEDDISEINVTKLLYRLKQIDFDGTFSYSDEVEVVTEPFDYALYQNFPNPFNPSTIIKYEVPKISNIKLEIFDVLGRNIRTLVNAEKPAGRYEVEFDASLLASGIYYYRIKASDFVQTKKMMLIK
ncbi:MAG: YCF48-related protein, partial [Ignavibacteriota bacterium]